MAWMIIEATTEDDDKGGFVAGRDDFPYEGRTASSDRAEFPGTEMESGSGSGLIENAKSKLGEAKEAVSGVAGTVKGESCRNG